MASRSKRSVKRGPVTVTGASPRSRRCTNEALAARTHSPSASHPRHATGRSGSGWGRGAAGLGSAPAGPARRSAGGTRGSSFAVSRGGKPRSWRSGVDLRWAGAAPLLLGRRHELEVRDLVLDLLPQLLHHLGLDLASALARQVEAVAALLQRERLLAVPR